MEGKHLFIYFNKRFNINVMVVVFVTFLEVATMSANCSTEIYIYIIFFIFFFCAVVLKWRKTKQQKLTCITAQTVRLHTAHLSVSKHSLCFLVMTS